MQILTPAKALWNQRVTLADHEYRLRAMREAVGRPEDLWLFQWAELFTYALEFRPNMILELGRGHGSSTCCFLEAAQVLRRKGPCRVISLCLSDDWRTRTEPNLRALSVPEDWFASGTIVVGDLLRYDLRKALRGMKRCLVFWDAPGNDVSGWVLGNLLPRLARSPNVVFLRDRPGMSRGDDVSNDPPPCSSTVAGFTAHNGLGLYSADDNLHDELGADGGKMARMRRLLPSDMFSLSAGWSYFSVNEAKRRVRYPRWVPAATVTPPPVVVYPPPQAKRGWVWSGLRLARGVARRVRRVCFAQSPG